MSVLRIAYMSGRVGMQIPDHSTIADGVKGSGPIMCAFAVSTRGSLQEPSAARQKGKEGLAQGTMIPEAQTDAGNDR